MSTALQPGAPPTLSALSLSEITLVDRAQVRERHDAERVNVFEELYRDAVKDAKQTGTLTSPLPPIVVVADGRGGYLLADGHHRYRALQNIGAEVSKVTVHVHVPNGNDPVAHAYALALIYATRSAKPLTSAEKRAAIRRVIAEQPELSNRHVARLVGVHHSTVDDLVRRAESAETDPEPQSSSSETPTRTGRRPMRWRGAAEQLIDIAELATSCQKRFGRGTDFDAAGRALHDALSDLCGEDADAILSDLNDLTEAAMNRGHIDICERQDAPSEGAVIVKT